MIDKIIDMKARIFIGTLALAMASFQIADARENVPNGERKGNKKSFNPKAATCAPGAGRTDIDLNNVRATIFTSGDMWWNLQNAPRYEIPVGSNRHSMFAASLWIGGVDNGGNLKVAAMTYRQSGNDFWPGPLDTIEANVTPDVCLQYDRHWKLTRQEVEDFVNNGAAATQTILSWPGNGDVSRGQAKFLAPFIDLNGNGFYEPSLGEYPGYDIDGTLGCDAKLFGDMTLWWVFNDKGNIHSETGGFPIGIEIRAQAFAFQTNNALNNMTFYNYEIINRSTFPLEEAYFGKWCDPDLGRYDDDYVGCDVQRGLGYCYNGLATDDGPQGYGPTPPAIGIDFFEGPFLDTNGIDDIADPCINPAAVNGLGFGDGIPDNERYGMSRFIYYENDFSVRGNPENAQHIYNYLRGFWKDGTPVVYNGTNGYGVGTPARFMYPGDTDPLGVGTNCVPQAPWSEFTAGNPPFDRRFLQSAGPFNLQAGAVNTITVGVPWARATAGDNLASVAVLKVVDEDAQALFNNCFSIINGPDAPVVQVVELDKEIGLIFDCYDRILDYVDSTNVPGFGNVKYKFQGYLIYQLRDQTVTSTELKDINRARLVAQCDIRDSIGQVINFYLDPNLNASVPVEEVNGANNGIFNSLRITTDLFATGDNRLVNHKTYHYLVLSYAVAEGVPADFPEPFLAGRRTCGTNVLRRYQAIPHINQPAFGGVVLNAQFGEGPQLTRVEGQGNGGNFLDLTDESIAQILRPPFWIANPVYKNSNGPINIKVVDPARVPLGDFELRLTNVNNQGFWTLSDGNQTIESKFNIGQGFEEIVPEFGFSITVNQVVQPGAAPLEGNGFIGASSRFQDVARRWLNFLADEEGVFNDANWIRSGSFQDPDFPAYNDYLDIDPDQVYEKVLDGTWAPARLVSRFNNGPFYEAGSAAQSLATLANLASVDVVFTPDKSKWSRCPVFETNEDPNSSQGGAGKLDIRRAPSVDKNGIPTGFPGCNEAEAQLVSATGMGWFPGYAINVETGERLNIAFGESSRLTEDRGRDMIFNPTHRVRTPAPPVPPFQNTQWFMGGKHFVYVFGHNSSAPNNVPRYDEGAYMIDRMINPAASDFTARKRNVWKDAMWVAIPLGVQNQPFLSNELVIKLRVQKPYRTNFNAAESANPAVNNNFPMYRFNTGDIFADKNNQTAAEDALSLINVVPNPYYAYSGYEVGQLDNRVKIINLPEKCKVTIYTTAGQLVRTFEKDSRITSIDWDLRNIKNIPIASGIYLIHVQVDGVGERVIKWLGVMRPIDLDAF